MSESISAQSFLTKRHRSPVERLVAWILMPLALLYRLTMAARGLLYRIGVFKTVKLPVKVISVGGITIGGAGKTPAVIHIVRILESMGRKAVILTRGYGGATKNITIIRPGDNIAQAAFSDEVILMSRRTSAVIGVGADRVAAFTEASRSADFDVAVLDDGFQHLRISRDLDIAAVDAMAPFGNRYMLPAGNLREPVPALRRADLILVTQVSQGGGSTRDLELLRRRFSNKVMLMADYVPCGMEDIHAGKGVDPGDLRDRPVFAFSAIANPESFFSTLERCRFTVGGRRAFRDHHFFTQPELDELTAEAVARGCAAFAVTEKDAVKLESLPRPEIPIYSYRIRLEIVTGEDSLRSVMGKLFDDKT